MARKLPATSKSPTTKQLPRRSLARKRASQSFQGRHPVTIGAGTLSGSFQRKVGKKHHLTVNYTLTREQSLVKYKKGRNVMAGKAVERGGEGVHHGATQPRGADGRYLSMGKGTSRKKRSSSGTSRGALGSSSAERQAKVSKISAELDEMFRGMNPNR